MTDSACEPPPEAVDVLVFGATAGGVMAAAMAARSEAVVHDVDLDTLQGRLRARGGRLIASDVPRE